MVGGGRMRMRIRMRQRCCIRRHRGTVVVVLVVRVETCVPPGLGREVVRQGVKERGYEIVERRAAIVATIVVVRINSHSPPLPIVPNRLDRTMPTCRIRQRTTD